MPDSNIVRTVNELRIGETFRDAVPRTLDISMVDRPVNIAPADGAQNLALPVTVQASGFSSGALAETTFTTAPDDAPTLIAYDGAAYDETPFPAHINNKYGGQGWQSPWYGTWVAMGFMRVESASPGLF